MAKTDTWIHCERCNKVIGKIEFNWDSPADIVIYDVGCWLFPEESICENCLHVEVEEAKNANGREGEEHSVL